MIWSQKSFHLILYEFATDFEHETLIYSVSSFSSSKRFPKFWFTILSQTLRCEISAHTSTNKITFSLFINKFTESTKFLILLLQKLEGVTNIYFKQIIDLRMVHYVSSQFGLKLPRKPQITGLHVENSTSFTRQKGQRGVV